MKFIAYIKILKGGASVAQISDMLFMFQTGNASGSLASVRSSAGRSGESGFNISKSSEPKFEDNLTTARNIKRSEYNRDDSDREYTKPLQRTPKDSDSVERAEQKLNKKTEQKDPDEEKKKPAKAAKKPGDDMEELLKLLESITAAQQAGTTDVKADDSEALEAVKTLADTVKAQGLNTTGEVKKDISKLVAMLKELAGEAQGADGSQAGATDVNQQIKELVDKILQAQQVQNNSTAVQDAEEDPIKSSLLEKLDAEGQKPAIQTLYNLNKRNYELKNLNSSEQAQTGQDSAKTAGNTTEEEAAKPAEDSKVQQASQNAPEENVKTADKMAADMVKQLQAKGKAEDVSEDKLQKLADKKEAVKEAIEEKSGQKAAEQQEITKTPATDKAGNKNVALDSKEQNSIIYKNEQLQNDKPFEKVMQAAKTERTPTAPKTDIINQIVKKAEVAIGDKQSEMRMQLEPENLGKLTLKVAVERGVVTAKFVAESQQVKEIIETNFNQLKDALQEKGINVQSFSVSVGQDSSNGGSEAYKQLWQDNIRTNSRSSYSTGNYVEAEEDYIARPVVNPYSYHEGRIDFKA